MGYIGERNSNEGTTNQNLILKGLEGWSGVFLDGCLHWKGVLHLHNGDKIDGVGVCADLIEVRGSLRGLVDIGMAHMERRCITDEGENKRCERGMRND